MVDGRIAERRAEVRRARQRARLRRTIAVLLLLLVAAAAVGFLRSEASTVRSVRVEGVERLAVEDVVEASGVIVGDSAVRLWPPRIVRRLESLPLVRTASVERRRLRDVVIVVTERAPVYGVVYRGEAVLVDRDGLVVDRGEPGRLPIVTVVSAPPRPGEPVAGHAALANAHRVWSGLSGPLRSRVVAMRAPDEDGLELTLGDGLVVRFGRAEQLEEKIRALGAVIDDVSGTEVTVVDVRVPGFPVVRID